MKEVKERELHDWTRIFCDEYGLPPCDVMTYIDMDDYVGIIGEADGGCLIVYEMYNVEKYCVAVEKSLLKNREFVYETLKRQLGKYKDFLEQERGKCDE